MRKPRKPKVLEVECPTIEELAENAGKFPEIPDDLRKVIWSTYKIKKILNLTEETFHYVDIMCMYFGVSRTQVITTAVKKMFSEVAPEIGKEKIAFFEKHMDIERMERLVDYEKEQTAKELSVEIREIERLDNSINGRSKKKRAIAWMYQSLAQRAQYKDKIKQAQKDWRKKYGTLRDRTKDALYTFVGSYLDDSD